MSRRTPLIVALALAIAASLAAVPAVAEPRWTDAEQLSVDMGELDTDVVTAPDGTALVAWVEEIDGFDRAVVRERTLSGQWAAVKSLSASSGHAERVRLATDGAGVVTAVWAFRETDGTRSIQVARRTPNGSWSAVTTVAEVTSATIEYNNPDVVASPGGRVVLTWEVENGVSATPAVSLRQDSGAWQTFNGVYRPGTIAHLRGVPDDTGRTTVVWSYDDGSNNSSVRAWVIGGDQTENDTRVLSSEAVSVSRPSLAVNAAGRATVSWTQQVDAGTIRVAAMVRNAGSPFPSSPTVLTDAVTSASRSTVTAAAPSGEAMVVFERQQRLFARSHNGTSWQPAVQIADANPGYLENPSLDVDANNRFVLAWGQGVTGGDRRVSAATRTGTTWGDPQVIAPAAEEAREPMISASTNGDALVSYREDVPTRHVRAIGLDGSGPVSTVPALKAIRLITSVPVTWSAQDRWSSIANHKVQRKVTVWNGIPGSFATWLANTTETSATSAIAVGRTMCFRSRATDEHGNIGVFADQRCTTTPVDDRTAVVRAGSWRDYTSASHYRGTFRASTAKGSRLEWAGARGRTFDLVAATGPGHGEVAVWLGAKLLKKVSLHRKVARTKVILPLGSLPTVSTGALQVRVVSDGKPVRIDGIAVRR